MLVGIPESSQAIIQSTLSIPSGNTHSNPPIQNRSNPRKSFQCPGQASKSPTDPLGAKTEQAPIASNHGSKTSDCTPSLNSTDSVSPGNYVDLLASATSGSSPFPATPMSRISPALVADRPAFGLLQSSPDISQTKAASNALPNQPSKLDLPAPSYGRSSNSSDQFTMPAPGTFSIRAPPSLHFLRSFDRSSSRQASGSTSWPTIELEGVAEEASETDVLSQTTVGACHTASPGGSTVTTGATPGPPEDKSGTRAKRKARGTKTKTNDQSAQSDGGQTEVELVKPPPTINGKISHGRKVPPGYVKRTPNSFLMFRSHVIANKLLPPGVENDNRQISRVVSGLWAGLSEEDLRTWQAASRELRAAVRAQNPGLKHAPNQKRRDVIRRRRSGQLPGETPEQRVIREKAAAAALAKVIIDSHGEKLDRNKLVDLTVMSRQASTSIEKIGSRGSSRERSRPEFRAPGYHLSHSNGLIQEAATARSEYAESTLTTSPALEPLRSLAPLPESAALQLPVQEDKSSVSSTPSGMSLSAASAVCNRSPLNESLAPVPTAQEIKQELNIDSNLHPGSADKPPLSDATLHQNFVSPSSCYRSSSDPSGVLSYRSGHSSPSTSAPPSTSEIEVSEGFSDTFSSEMLRSLGLTVSDLGLNLPTSASITETTNNMIAPNSNCTFWEQGSSFDSFSNFNTSSYPFSHLTISEESHSQTASTRMEYGSLTTFHQFSRLEPPKSFDFSSMPDSNYNDPLGCNGLNFDSIYLAGTSSSMSTSVGSEVPCPSFAPNFFEDIPQSRK